MFGLWTPRLAQRGSFMNAFSETSNMRKLDENETTYLHSILASRVGGISLLYQYRICIKIFSPRPCLVPLLALLLFPVWTGFYEYVIFFFFNHEFRCHLHMVKLTAIYWASSLRPLWSIKYCGVHCIYLILYSVDSIPKR